MFISLFSSESDDKKILFGVTFALLDFAEQNISLKNTTILIKDIALNESSKSNLIPFKYKSIKMEADSIFYKTSIYENINLKHLLFEDQKLTLHGFNYKNKYSKKEYEKLLIIQRDYYDVTVEKLIINELAVGKENDSIFLKTNLISIDKASAAIYRDKFEKEEDLRLKKLYSRAIRELPIKLTVDSVSVKNSTIEQRGYFGFKKGLLRFNKIPFNYTYKVKDFL